MSQTFRVVADVLHTLCNEAHHERRGDLNGDGQITVVDAAVIALQMAVSGGTTMVRM